MRTRRPCAASKLCPAHATPRGEGFEETIFDRLEWIGQSKRFDTVPKVVRKDFYEDIAIHMAHLRTDVGGPQRRADDELRGNISIT